MNIQNGDTRQVPEKCIELFVLCFGGDISDLCVLLFFFGGVPLLWITTQKYSYLRTVKRSCVIVH